MLFRKDFFKKVSIIFFLFLTFSILTLSGTGMACRMYGVISDNLPDGLLQSHLINESNSLKNLAQSGNVDGWGIAYYPEYGDTATTERGAEKAFTDADYDTVVGQINTSEPKITIAHIRHCTAGCCSHGTETIANPHPFYRDRNGKTWTFVHNGGVSKTLLYDLIDDDDYLNQNAPYGSGVGTCTTSDPYDSLVVDSEIYFLYILKKIEEHNWNAVKGIVDAVTELIDLGENGMNFIMSDGYAIWAFRKGELSSHTLYYLDESANGYVAVASEYPSSDQGDWELIEHGELVVLTDEGAPVIIDVNTYTEDLLADSDFNDSIDSADLRDDTADEQDWYESRDLEDDLLTLDEDDIGGNNTKKAKLQASSSGNAYLSQEFNVPQTGTFSVQWDIYVDEILNISSPDRAGWVLIGDDTNPTRPGPNSDDSERFVYMAFFKDGGGTDGTMDLVARDRDDEWASFTTVASGLNIGQWYTIKVVCDLFADTYDVYVDGVYQATVTSRHTKGSLTHTSFAQWNDGAGTFYVDNVTESFVPSQTLIVDSNFTDSADSVDLRDDAPGEQDWYESRGQDPSLLTLDENDIGGNNTKKAKLEASASTNAYLSQEFNAPQSGTFTVQWDVYVDNILDDGDRDRAALMMLGDDSDENNQPNSTSSERFVFLAFWCPDGGGDNLGDTMSLIAREPGDSYGDSSTWREIASGLGFDTWHTITVTCDVVNNTYNVYVDGVLIGAGVAAYTGKDSLTHISFAQWNDGAGTFYVDNVTETSPPPPPLILDSYFWLSADSDDLRTYSPPPGYHQDWYESRGDDPSLLTLDLNDIGGNSTKKAKLAASASTNGYLSQEFNEPQTGTFTVQWDIYVDQILGTYGDTRDRAGFMMIGDDSGGTNGPNSANSERFVYMAFSKPGGGTDGTMDLVARDRDDEWTSFTTIASGLNLDQWYTITVACDVDTDTYAVYVDGVLMATVTSRNEKASVTHISFAQWNDGAGTFYVDNVMEGPETPQAFFSATPTSGTMPLEVAFTDLSTGEISSWLWDFGDSETSDVQNPTHIYTNPGLYTVSLTVTNPGGTDTETKESYVEVLPIEIPNDNTGDDFEVVGDWVESTLVPGYYGDNYYYIEPGTGESQAIWYFNIPIAGTYKVYAWWSAPYRTRASNAPYTINHAFGSTTVRVDQRINGGQWNELGEFYFEVDTYSVVLTNDADGAVVADAVEVVFVSDQIPPSDADFSADVRTGQAPLTVQFADHSTGPITEWLWDFGDGGTSTEQNPTHVYENNGIYTVTLTVTGPQGTDVEIKENYIEVSEVEIIIDNSDADFTVVGSWPASTKVPGYYAGDYLWNISGQGNDQAVWNFNIPRSGIYKVYAWWSAPYSTRSSNAPYSINHGLGSTTVRMDQRTNGSQWNELGEFYFEENNYSVVLSDDADRTVVADAIRIVFLNDQIPPPQADFIADIRTGLSPLTVNFSDQSGGNITEWNWDFGDGGTSNEPNPTHIFTTDGEYTVSLTVSGSGGSDTETKEYFIVVSRDTIIIDNSDDDFSVVGSWPTSTWVPGYYGSNYQYNNAGAGNDQAIWTIRITKSGTYRLYGWWSAPYSTRPSNAPYTINHAFGDTMIRVDQRSNGHQWNEFGDFYFEEGNNYSVVLTDDADGAVVADAIRFTFLYSEVPPCHADFSVDTRFGEPPLTVNFTDLSSGDITAWNWDFGDGGTSTEQNPTHVYENNGIYTVTLTVHDTYGSDIETKESFITVSDVEIIIDNSDADFSVVGSWPASTKVPGYYGSDYQYNNAGTGNDQAIWNFNIPSSGTYKVYAWWSAPYSTRPSNAPYTINHAFGSTNIQMDQRGDGSQWNELGDFYFEEGNNYSVVLTDDADGAVAADAVRVVLIDKEPPVDFSADIRLGLLPLTVNFTDQSGGDITAWNWDFGDGGTSTEQNPTHVYDETGTFTVTLTVTDSEGTRSETKEDYITVSDVEIIIDNSDVDFSMVGSWPSSITVSGYYAVDYLWNNSGQGNDQAIWNFNIPSSGTYKVYAWWSAPYSTRPSNAPYTINHAFGSTNIQMDQRGDGSQWNELGDFYFEEGNNYSVVLTDDADGNVVADAVRVLFISEDPPAPHAEFSCDVEMGPAPLTVQFTDQSTGFITAWTWDFGDGGTSNEQNPTNTYTSPGVYPVSLTVFNSHTNDTITKEHAIVVEGIEGSERIYAFFVYYTNRYPRKFTVSMLEEIGAFKKDNLWVYWDQPTERSYLIEIIEGLEGYDKWKEALKTENAHIIYDGHANYGSGHVFATLAEEGIQEVADIEYIDDDRILNFSSKYFSIPIYSYTNTHAFPNWEPFFQDGSCGVMPYTYNDPEFPGDPDNPGIPAFNYYITYQVPGDPAYYKAESAHRGPIERFPGCGKPAWYSPDGELPDYHNPDHQKYFITRSWGSGVRPHYSNRTILFRKDLEVSKEEFKYSRMFTRTCNSGFYYTDTYNQGIHFCTFGDSNSASPTSVYLRHYLMGSSDEQIYEVLQAIEPVFDYYNFDEPPPEREPTFAIQWDVYVDNILDDGDRDRAALMMLGDDSDENNQPNSTSSERFVFLAFWCPDGGGDNPGDTMSLIAREPGDSYGDSSAWREVASGLSFDTWHTIKVTCDLIDNTYDVYINDDLVGNDIPAYSNKDTVTHISFAQWDDGAGTFYVDDVIPLLPDSTFIVDHNFNTSVDSADLIDNGAGRDWYESRNDVPGLLTLDVENVGGNSTKKARFEGSLSGNAYLSQEFSPPQSE